MSRTGAYRGEGLPGDPGYVACFGGFWLLAGAAMHLIGMSKDDIAVAESAHNLGNIFLIGAGLMFIYALKDYQLESEGEGPQVAHA